VRFADVFAGLGGFHVALGRLGHECVFASEIDEELRAVYQRNFGLLPAGDICHVAAADVPEHEVLCAGFPCQPFSLAGKKIGTKCPESGKLIDDVFRLVRQHSPQYVLLENVPNVLTIANGTFWESIRRRFVRLGYTVEHRTYSPLDFGVPQQRVRLFVVARAKGTPGFCWPEPPPTQVRSLSDYVRSDAGPYRLLEPGKSRAISKWNEVVARFHGAIKSHTILATEFGATYPVEGLKPGRPWRSHQGAFGKKLAGADSLQEAVGLLPQYAMAKEGAISAWQLPDVAFSRWLYDQDPAFFDAWKADVTGWPNSWQKLEWRGDKALPSLWSQTIQFRASGIRVMRPDMAPSLVAMSPTQTPILGPKRRYISVREAASLQSLSELHSFPENNERAFRALGNAVNAQIVYEIAKAVLQ